MAAKTHQEVVLEAILAQWDDRVSARARLIGRPLGYDAVSDNKARELYWKRNPNPQAVLMAVQQHPEMTDWQITCLIYTSRKDVLEAVRNEKGDKAMIAFDARMQAQGPPEQGMPGDSNAPVQPSRPSQVASGDVATSPSPAPREEPANGQAAY